MKFKSDPTHSSANRNHPEPDAANAEVTKVGWPSGPTMRFKELIKLLSVSKSKAYELMKTDPDFPKGIPLYEGGRSPKFYWTREAIAWIEGRASKIHTQRRDN